MVKTPLLQIGRMMTTFRRSGMGMGSIIGPMEQDTKENGLTIKFMARELFGIQMETFTAVSFKMTWPTAMVSTTIPK